MNDHLQNEQQLICEKYNVEPFSCPENMKIGVSLNVRDGISPVNGLRIEPEGDTTGWYIWGGEEFSDSQDFFKPLHVSHIKDWNALVLPYLKLPPGWRFLVTDEYEDVWYDEELLKEKK